MDLEKPKRKDQRNRLHLVKQQIDFYRLFSHQPLQYWKRPPTPTSHFKNQFTQRKTKTNIQYNSIHRLSETPDTKNEFQLELSNRFNLLKHLDDTNLSDIKEHITETLLTTAKEIGGNEEMQTN